MRAWEEIKKLFAMFGGNLTVNPSTLGPLLMKHGGHGGTTPATAMSNLVPATPAVAATDTVNALVAFIGASNDPRRISIAILKQLMEFDASGVVGGGTDTQIQKLISDLGVDLNNKIAALTSRVNTLESGDGGGGNNKFYVAKTIDSTNKRATYSGGYYNSYGATRVTLTAKDSSFPSMTFNISGTLVPVSGGISKTVTLSAETSLLNALSVSGTYAGSDYKGIPSAVIVTVS